MRRLGSSSSLGEPLLGQTHFSATTPRPLTAPGLWLLMRTATALALLWCGLVRAPTRMPTMRRADVDAAIDRRLARHAQRLGRRRRHAQRRLHQLFYRSTPPRLVRAIAGKRPWRLRLALRRREAGHRRRHLFEIRAEHRYGQTIVNNVNCFISPTIIADLPVFNSDQLYLTNFLLSRKFGDNQRRGSMPARWTRSTAI